ncbi:hypothetical protein L226DRAFT_531145 [Lentinus tigrinus ALCF2SS1-7]|uniref:F-box domain-containing protein n=1 Tax=Lentinus tigrinus ALCF2SS1-6 TaxID=1328759 RepID=A0A5C2SPJ9_9APHY|nr:hypothetical protein L227DRAFT_570604 [Lentinus tigrinus ALCF2SS1-6]RPD79327.1 hypothetical protein L226DRAFT_531145 [Lentinus tigrinus ALCF2SS1-7]
MSLLALPDELIVQIACLLAPTDLLHIQEVCLRLQDVVQNNAALQYTIQLYISGMIDNPSCRLVPAERLRILRAKEDAWRQLNLSDRTVLPLNHHPSGIYDLTGGVLLLGERKVTQSLVGTDNVHTVKLHSAFGRNGGDGPGSSSLWRKIDLGKQVIDVGLAIQEHDLIAIVTYSYINEAQLWASIDIQLFEHSTGQPHPDAAQPVIHFDNIYYLPGHCSIMLEISGDTLCFLMNNYFPFVTSNPVSLVIFDWKTGRRKAKRAYQDPTMFNSFVLLSPDIVVLPIIPTNALEICHFAQELAAPAPPPAAGEAEQSLADVPNLVTSCVLELPVLQGGAIVLRMTCRCEPNPRGPPSSATHPDTLMPFYSDPATSAMILHMHIRIPHNSSRVYTMIVQRSSLLKAFHEALALRRRCREEGILPQPPSYPDMPSQEHFAKLAYLKGPYDTQTRFRIFDWDSITPDMDLEQVPLTLSWQDWGPRVTRWFQDELASTRWITTTCGQRFVRFRDSGRLHVYDFNGRSIKRYLNERKLRDEPVGSKPGESIVKAGTYYWPRRGGDSDEEGPLEVVMEENEEEEGGEMLDQDGWLADLNTDEESPQGAETWHAVGEQPQAAESSGSGNGYPIDPKRRMKVMLGTTVIREDTVWEESIQSSMPYIETSVRIAEEWESALIDEDIIVGLKMDANLRHITEVVLHRIGGPVS